MPALTGRAVLPGCFLAVMLVCFALAVVAGLVARNAVVFGLVAAPGLVVAAGLARRALYGRHLLARVRAEWAPVGRSCLVVHSASLHWREAIATRWLPRLAARAVSLDWSERAHWRDTLEVRLFRHFALAERNFVPVVIVFRELDEPLVFRFYYAFLEARAGRPQYLEELEASLFETLGV